MAATAQLDCGQCGYLCQSYAEALAEGRETSTSLCVPGGKPTARTGESSSSPRRRRPPSRPRAGTASPAKPAGRPVRVLSAEPLTGPGSAKDVRHVVIDLPKSGLTYEPGDSIGLAAPNDPALVDATLAALGAPATNRCPAPTAPPPRCARPSPRISTSRGRWTAPPTCWR